MLHAINRSPSVAEIRKFGITILIGMGLIGALLWWLAAEDAAGMSWTGSGGQWLAVALWILGGVVAILSLTSPSIGKPIYVAWMSVAAAIGFVTIPLLLTILYFVLLPVFSLIRFKDPLRSKKPLRVDPRKLGTEFQMTFTQVTAEIEVSLPKLLPEWS